MRKEKDYTRQRKGGEIIVCPKCGRKGFRRRYADGAGAVFHRIEYRGSIPVVTDLCMAPANELT